MSPNRKLQLKCVMPTSESAKLYSERPATRNPTIAARLPTTSAPSRVEFSESHRSRLMPLAMNAAQIQSQAARFSGG